MEKFKNKNRFIQFELWKDCSLGCKFCFNKKQKDIDELYRKSYNICKRKVIRT